MRSGPTHRSARCNWFLPTAAAGIAWVAGMASAKDVPVGSGVPEPDEYAVYAAVFVPNEPEIPDALKADSVREKLFRAAHRELIDLPVVGGSGPRFVRDLTTMRQLRPAPSAAADDAKAQREAAMVADFNAKNAEPAQLENHFPTELGVTLLPEATLGEMSRDGGWEEFRKRYPAAGGLVTLSRVGFDPDRTQAVVYVQHIADYEMGVGYFLYLEKARPGGPWVIVGATLAFRS